MAIERTRIAGARAIAPNRKGFPPPPCQTFRGESRRVLAEHRRRTPELPTVLGKHPTSLCPRASRILLQTVFLGRNHRDRTLSSWSGTSMPREKSSWLSSAGSSKLSWWLLGGMPEDEVFGAHEVEVGDDQAVVRVDPDGHQGLAAGALGAHRGGGELDLLLGHALDGDLAGGAAADRGDDGQAIGADGDVAVAWAAWPRVGPGPAGAR